MKEQIFKELVNYIERIEKEKGEISLFSWSHALRCKIDIDYPNHNMNFEEKRGLYLDAYDVTHPQTPARRLPETPAPFSWKK